MLDVQSNSLQQHQAGQHFQQHNLMSQGLGGRSVPSSGSMSLLSQGRGLSNVGNLQAQGSSAQMDPVTMAQRQQMQGIAQGVANTGLGNSLLGQQQPSSETRRLLAEAEIRPQERMVLEQAAELRKRRIMAEQAIQHAMVSFLNTPSHSNLLYSS